MMLIQVAPGQSLQTVIDALPADDQPVTIHLAPGVYEEKIALRRPRTCIEGESAETTRITWHDGAAEILPDGKKRGTFRTATLLINASDCALRSVTVENSAYPREQVGQALALYVDGDGFCCEDCTLKSCQDTLFTAPLPPREIQKDGFIGPTQFLPLQINRPSRPGCQRFPICHYTALARDRSLRPPRAAARRLRRYRPSSPLVGS